MPITCQELCTLATKMKNIVFIKISYANGKEEQEHDSMIGTHVTKGNVLFSGPKKIGLTSQ